MFFSKKSISYFGDEYAITNKPFFDLYDITNGILRFSLSLLR